MYFLGALGAIALKARHSKGYSLYFSGGGVVAEWGHWWRILTFTFQIGENHDN